MANLTNRLVNAQAKKPKSLWWFEPGWSFRPRLKREFSEAIQVTMLPRIVAVVVLLTVPPAYYLKRAMPDLEFDWAGKLVLRIGAMVLALACFYGLSWLIPPIIGIKKTRCHAAGGPACFLAAPL